MQRTKNKRYKLLQITDKRSTRNYLPLCPISCFVSAYLGDPLTEDSLGLDSKQAAGLPSHTDKAVEDKGAREKGMGWGEVRGVEYNYWVAREV